MKKVLLFLVFTLMAGLALTGCSQNDGGNAEATTTQDIATEAADGSAKDNTDDAGAATTEKAASTTAQNTNSGSYDFSSYEKRIDSVTKEVNNAKTSSSTKTNQDRFFALKQKINAIDNDLDSLDDTFEHAYESGDMTFDTYKSRERSIEKLEDQLDLAEDALENKFGIDD